MSFLLDVAKVSVSVSYKSVFVYETLLYREGTTEI